MTRRAARVTQADIARALRAAAQMGERMAVEIAPDGTIRITKAPDPERANPSKLARKREIRL
jgi:hypothetical protein